MKTIDLEKTLKTLNSDGYAVLENYFDEDFCNRSILSIEKKIDSIDSNIENSLGAGGDIRLFKFENISKEATLFSKNKLLLKIAEDYTKKKLSTHFVLAGKLEHSNDIKANSGGGWHRDSDGIQFKAMVYLNDVNSKNGPFLFVTNSKTKDAKRERIRKFNSFLFYVKRFIKYQKIRDPRYSDNSISNFFRKRKYQPIEIVASKGSVVLFDGSFIHRGKEIQSGLRYSLTNYYYGNDEKAKTLTLKKYGHLFLKRITHE